MTTHVLFISRQRMVGAINGSSSYLLDLARAVRAAGMVPHLLQPTPSVSGRWPVLCMRPEMQAFESHAIRALLRLGRYYLTWQPAVWAALLMSAVRFLARRSGVKGAWARDVPMPYAVAGAWSGKDHAWLHRRAARLAAKRHRIVAVADYMFCADGFVDLPPCPRVIVMHDLFHARDGNGADSVAQVTREDEIERLSRADAVLAIQAEEAWFVSGNVPGVKPILAPMAVTPVDAPSIGEDRRLLFVGSNTAPNVVGLRWFLDEVWPLLLADVPGISLDVAGSVGRAFSTLKWAGNGAGRVRVLGFVDDLGALYAKAGVVISPLTFGSGLKIKLIEALAQGKAIVATPVTMQGVEGPCDGALRVAQDPLAFADHVRALSLDREARWQLGEAALDVARTHFGPERCYAGFVDWLKRVDQVAPSACRNSPPG